MAAEQPPLSRKDASGQTPDFALRAARETDLDALCALENASFATDRLSRRRFKHWIGARNRVFLIAEGPEGLLGYGLVLLHRGTRLARLYSIAVDAAARGRGLAQALLKALEAATAERGRLYMRLEVAEDNHAAVNLYRRLGYAVFGRYADYYEDHQAALRMQKRIRYVPENLQHLQVPWYQQTTDFTCGPAATMMAMAALQPTLVMNRALELDLWREATTIYMTSGHGGCHPVGLALSAAKRGFVAEVYLNRSAPLFVEGVRDPEKKQIVSLVHDHFLHQAQAEGVAVHYSDATQQQIEDWIRHNQLVIALISTYRMDRRKAPHWVVLTAVDDECLYVHDPDPSTGEHTSMDCQYVPIARADFDKMSQFGRHRLRALVVIGQHPPTASVAPLLA